MNKQKSKFQDRKSPIQLQSAHQLKSITFAAQKKRIK
jgi:hypothetical protein